MTITEVSRKCGVTPDTLRYYEKIGLLPPVQRTAGGIRNYSNIDCEWIEFIKCMRCVSIPIEVLAEYVELFMKGVETAERRKNILMEQREKIREKIKQFQDVEAHISYKIAHYDEDILPAERKLREGFLNDRVNE